MRVTALTIWIICLVFLDSFSQDPLRFKSEIENFKSKDKTELYEEVVLFTGSSSVRFWSTIEEDFPEVNVINRGFGGSHFSDLIYFSDQLILQYQPQHIFIYEGDNDVSAGKEVEDIITDAETLVYKIRRSLPKSHIYLISAKPSIARWNFKDQYLKLNKELKQWTKGDELLHYVDVWTPMCDESGEVMKDIFVQDDLHMNVKGYDIWREAFGPFIDEIYQEESQAFDKSIGVQAYSFRNYFPKDVIGTLDKIEEMGITQIEGDGGRIPNEEFRRLCSARGITIPSTGCNFEELKSDPMSIVKKAKALGASYVMCPWIPHKKRGEFNLEEAKLAVEVFNQGGKVLKENGITFCYHPHGYEMQKYEEGTLLDYIIQNTKSENVSFEMDVFWIQFGGGDPVELLEKYPQRWKMLHLKDMKSGIDKNLSGLTDVEFNVPLGTGQIDMEGIMKTARKIGVKYYFIEDESSAVMNQVPESIEYLRSLTWE